MESSRKGKFEEGEHLQNILLKENQLGPAEVSGAGSSAPHFGCLQLQAGSRTLGSPDG